MVTWPSVFITFPVAPVGVFTHYNYIKPHMHALKRSTYCVQLLFLSIDPCWVPIFHSRIRLQFLSSYKTTKYGSSCLPSSHKTKNYGLSSVPSSQGIYKIRFHLSSFITENYEIRFQFRSFITENYNVVMGTCGERSGLVRSLLP